MDSNNMVNPPFNTYSNTPDRPFDPIGIRELHDKIPGYDNTRLTDDQILDLINNPELKPQRRLPDMTKEAQTAINKDHTDRDLMNLSLKQILTNTSNSVSDILDDLLSMNIFDLKQIADILTKNDRMIYLGIILLFISIALIIIRNTSFNHPYIK